MEPLARYQADQTQPNFLANAEQLAVAERLQQLYLDVCERNEQSQPSWWHFWKDPAPIKGIYMWGGVGRGKTYLMDLFYDALPFKKKLRSHYHEFMRSIHNALANLPEQSDPMEQIADDIATQAHVLCLDEFHVLDITDAMLLTKLTTGLLNRHMVLVFTSNLPPSEQYKDGLQRAAFLPTILALQKHTDIIELSGDIDYRKREAVRYPNYSYPHNDEQQQKLAIEFQQLSRESSLIHKSSVLIQQRPITVVMQSHHAIWFEFSQICETARASQDYVELSLTYQFFIISNIPQLTEESDDACKRFIQLIDTLYEKHRWVIITAEMPLDTLYTGKRHHDTFLRTISRLLEMQTETYLQNCQ